MDSIENSHSDFIFYRSHDGNIKIQVVVDDERETIWVTQKSMSEIFDVDISGIARHLKNIYESGELSEDSTLQKMQIANSTKPVNFYNLDVIISVGYRVNSYKATQFRVWASSILKQYMVKGFVLNDDRLKQGKNLFGKDYFDELLEKIREIRSSERRFWQKITDLYAQGSIDYDSASQITKDFYATVQNKLHWAIHQHTAVELIKERADSNKPFMGLTSFKNSESGGKILKTDIGVAKNYLSKDELAEMNRLVSMLLDFAENLAKRGKKMTMADWSKRLNAFLEFNEYEVLDDLGSTTSKIAKNKAAKEYEKFRVIQDTEYESDFDNTISVIKETGQIPEQKGEKFSIKAAMKKLKEIQDRKKPSEFNAKLEQGLNWNPNAPENKK
jgi:hypothetical protein